jgi:hypothetical protein
MEDFLKKENIEFFMVIFLPGMISMQIYRLIVPTDAIEWKHAVLQALFYSGINFALCFPILVLTGKDDLAANHPAWYYLRSIGTLFLLPVFWPIAFVSLTKTKLFQKYFLSLFPTAWDAFFSLRKSAFILIHLKSGKMVGGYYGKGSYATSYPHDGDLYISAVYQVDDKGHFKKPMPDTRGLLIRKDEYSYIELFDVPKTERSTKCHQDETKMKDQETMSSLEAMNR